MTIAIKKYKVSKGEGNKVDQVVMIPRYQSWLRSERDKKYEVEGHSGLGMPIVEALSAQEGYVHTNKTTSDGKTKRYDRRIRCQETA